MAKSLGTGLPGDALRRSPLERLEHAGTVAKVRLDPALQGVAPPNCATLAFLSQPLHRSSSGLGPRTPYPGVSMSRVLLPLLFALTTAVVNAAEPATQSDPRAVIAAKLRELELTVEDVRPSKIKGLYEIRIGPDTAYVSADGRYLIAGDMYDVESRENISERARMTERREALAKLDERDAIIFAPSTKVEHTITVFTDVDCGYCRRLHSQIDELMQLGIRVRYLAFPRSGKPGSPDWRKMEAVWCSKDRQAAITKAKRGEQVSAPPCGTAAVAKQFALGERLGVRGTPAIFTNSGEYIGGYLTPDQMVNELNRLSAEAKKAQQ